MKRFKEIFLNTINKYRATISEKKNCLQKRICHNVAPSNDLTIKPPKLKKNAPRNTNNGPGNFEIKFI